MFAAILDRLSEEKNGNAAARFVRWSGIRGLNVGFVWTGSTAEGTAGGGLSGYYETEDGAGFEPPPPPVRDVSMFKRLDREEIAKDLGLLANDTVATLKLKRRAFARINHPDRAPEEWREAATMRMKTANLMIDEALLRAALKQR